MSNKTIIHHPEAPAPVGPYNQAVLVNDTLYISGQIAIDQASGNLVLDSIENESRRIMQNLGLILKAAGMGFENVVKCSVFVKDMGMYGRINAVYSEYFDESTAPARELVEVGNLPKYVNVEISCIAVK